MTQQELIQEYLNGKSISALSRETEYTYCSIQKILRENNITVRGGRKKKELSEQDFLAFKQDYEVNNLMWKELSNKYKFDASTLKRIAEEHKLVRPNCNRVNRQIISNYFSKIDTPEKAYWVGFLFTDGSVNETFKNDKQVSSRIRLQLQECDKEILEKFKEDLHIDSKLIYDKREGKHCYSVEFVDNQIYNDLAKFGIIPQKTYKVEHLKYEDIPEEFLPAYILGLFDGDGCLTYSSDFSTDVTFGFTTYYESVAKDFQNLIDEKILHKLEHNKLVFISAWHANWRGRIQVLQILDYLYEHCPRHLERKYQKYLALKNSLK